MSAFGHGRGTLNAIAPCCHATLQWHCAADRAQADLLKRWRTLRRGSSACTSSQVRTTICVGQEEL